LLDHITQEDPNFVVDWVTYPNNKVFQQAFIFPSATQYALQYLQLQVSLHACQTKNRRFLSQLFMAIVIDGNSKVYILCYGIALGKNLDNWLWFCQCFQKFIIGIGDVDIPIIFDRHKGLLCAVFETFPR
jgi:hypothetical protein